MKMKSHVYQERKRNSAILIIVSATLLGLAYIVLERKLGDIYAINVIIGLLSAIVDNVPLVAAAQGMYPLEASGVYGASGKFWQMLAYCAGTGGSALIIGSAAGVAVMGLEKINFFWYLKKISGLALIGYFAGAITFYLMYH